ncbi:hypothetical protein COV19_05200 [Candidatus Woesearchaeota archaeon CG10_big_fil_rev_8_21_14_0_10_44_13]|nr:MAG: hypothetical protein COV19_05200 [Candidatus Woesearchaeota archaeon CG10_big_fil_rev_8_21_14_0_10_44_13]
MKFGGTSVGSVAAVQNVHKIVKERLDKAPIVVVSALSGITDALIKSAKDAEQGRIDDSAIRKKHNDLLKGLGLDDGLVDDELSELLEVLKTIAEEGLTKRSLDHVQSFGERMSSKIVAAYMTKKGMNARALNSYDVGLVTDSNFTEAEIDSCSYENLKKNPLLKEKGIVNVVTGYIAKDHKGDITTLGRGGSDFTAAIIGAALDAEEVQIWTDVDGILTSDPKIVKNAVTIDEISFEEAAELAYFGAKVVHPKTIIPATENNIPVLVLNTHNPSHKGTRIVKSARDAEHGIFKAISSKKNVTIIRIVSSRMLGVYGFLAVIFDIFRNHKIAVDMVSTSEISVSVSVGSKDDIGPLIEDLEKIGSIEVRKKRAIVCIVGKGMKNIPGVSGKIFSVCGDEKINVEMISQGASQVNMGFIVDEGDADRIVVALHRELIEKRR